MLYLATWGVERDLESGKSGSQDCNPGVRGKQGGSKWSATRCTPKVLLTDLDVGSEMSQKINQG